MSRPRFKFQGNRNGTLRWEAPIPGDSRSESISCTADWFYGAMLGTEPERPWAGGLQGPIELDRNGCSCTTLDAWWRRNYGDRDPACPRHGDPL